MKKSAIAAEPKTSTMPTMKLPASLNVSLPKNAAMPSPMITRMAMARARPPVKMPVIVATVLSHGCAAAACACSGVTKTIATSTIKAH